MIELRELTLADAQALQRIFSPESTKFLGRAPMDAADARLYAGNAVASVGRRPRSLYTLGLTADDDLLGVVKLCLDRPLPSVSYVLRPDTWGRGYATEGLRILLALAFGQLGLPAVHAKHHPDNPASGRALVKAGFIRTGRVSGFETYVNSADRPGHRAPRGSPAACWTRSS